jgi:NAD(P)-dependent dehydrogenase (short-subunit alcohol dehydrogenase family)
MTLETRRHKSGSMFLASAQASYVTGAMVPLDGGMLRLDLK